jgi:uracil phosphoribosyltransferase
MAIYVVEHPLIRHKLGILRQHNVSVREFREISNEICRLLTYEATKNLKTEKATIQGWAGPVEVERIQGKMITAVPILRAGIGMLDGFLDMIPGAKVSVVGIFRNEETLAPVRYYVKLARNMEFRTAVILDPMLATGGTLCETVRLLKEAGCKSILGLFLVCAPQGIARLQQEHLDVDVYTASIDQGLNKNGYILPGLGDAGDKIFGTI